MLSGNRSNLHCPGSSFVGNDCTCWCSTGNPENPAKSCSSGGSGGTTSAPSTTTRAPTTSTPASSSSAPSKWDKDPVTNTLNALYKLSFSTSDHSAAGGSDYGTDGSSVSPYTASGVSVRVKSSRGYFEASGSVSHAVTRQWCYNYRQPWWCTGNSWLQGSQSLSLESPQVSNSGRWCVEVGLKSVRNLKLTIFFFEGSRRRYFYFNRSEITRH